MVQSFLRLWLGVFLIFIASAVLLLTDRERPRAESGSAGSGPSESGKVRSVALFQHVSQPSIEDGAKGVIARLAASGYRDGEGIRLRRFNAEGDAATSNTIAREVVGGDYDLVITLSTPSLQAVAGANRDAKVPHVFGMVSDPVVAGVGIAREDPKKHPPYMVGLGTMQPVAEAFRMARRIAPKLARVGVAWNPSEANSEACTKVARRTCKELGIELIEANVEGSAAVREAVASVVGRGAEAVWVGGDTTVLAALDGVIGPAKAAGVPVFTNIPGSAARGALFDLGADYYRVGGKVGELAGRVLGGESPAAMPILYEVPPEFWINRVALAEIKGGWAFPRDIEDEADVVVEKGGPARKHPRVEAAAPAPRPARPSRTWTVGVASYSDSTVVEDALEGVREGLKAGGLVDGRDFALSYRSAQGDIATLNSLMDELSGGETDLVVSFTTPGLQAALRKIDRKPLIFGVVLDPFAAGAGKSATDHRSNVTGAYLTFPYPEMARTLREIFPKVRRVGTLFTPGEMNSVLARDRFEKVLKAEGMELVAASVNGPTEVSDAALSLCQSRIDVFCQISDSLSTGTFPAIARACETAKMPLFAFSPPQVERGAIVGVGCDYTDNGREAGRIAAEVILGKDPSRIPFLASKRIRYTVNLETARRFGVTIPAEWVKKADLVLPARPDAEKPR